MSQTIESKNKALVLKAFDTLFNKRDYVDRFHGMYPPNINEGTHPISVTGPTQYQVVPMVF